MEQKKKQQPAKRDRRLENLVHTLPLEGKGDIISDVNGSYTGTPVDGGVPVQDADDL